MTRRIVRMIDLVDRPELIAEYEAVHANGNVPADVLASERRRGIVELEIYRLGVRLVMIMDVTDDYDADGLEEDASTIPDFIAWRRRMGVLQRPLAGAEDWAVMPRVFRHSEHPVASDDGGVG